MGSGERIFLVAMLGTSPASARTFMVTDNEKIVAAFVGAVQDHLNPGAEFERAIAGNLPGPKLVADPQGYGGHYDPADFDHERRAVLTRINPGGEHRTLVETRYPPLLDLAFELVKSAPSPEPKESPARQMVSLSVQGADASRYGAMRGAGATGDPDVLAEFIKAYCDSDMGTDGEVEILRSLLPEIAEAAALEKADARAWRERDEAQRERDEAQREVASQELWLNDSRRQAVAARDRVAEAKRRTLRPSEQKLAEMETEAAEAERSLASAEQRLKAAKAAAIVAGVRAGEARKAYDAQLARTEVEGGE